MLCCAQIRGVIATKRWCCWLANQCYRQPLAHRIVLPVWKRINTLLCKIPRALNRAQDYGIQLQHGPKRHQSCFCAQSTEHESLLVQLTTTYLKVCCMPVAGAGTSEMSSLRVCVCCCVFSSRQVLCPASQVDIVPCSCTVCAASGHCALLMHCVRCKWTLCPANALCALKCTLCVVSALHAL